MWPSVSEAAVKRKITRLLKAHGAYYTMPHQRGYSRKGVPDYVGWAYGIPFAVEAKYGDNQPTEFQEIELREAERAGGVALVINETNVRLLELWLQWANEQ